MSLFLIAISARTCPFTEEKENIIKIAKDETYSDLSHRQLAVVASETGQIEASASSFYRVMKKRAVDGEAPEEA